MTASQRIFTNANWYKGNLHTHSTRSDGQLEFDKVVEWYQKHGYDFLSVTDHNTFCPGQEQDNFVLLSGTELSAHTVGFGMKRWRELPDGTCQQGEIDGINELGGVSVIAHPYWHGLTLPYLQSLDNYLAIEVYNSECDVMNARGYSSVIWDYLFGQGKRVLGLAVDDIHWRRGNEGRGWICVNANQLSAQTLISEIRNGSFYSTQGPSFTQISVDHGTIHVDCSPVARINFVTDPPFGRVVQAKGATLEGATFELASRLTYVRVEIIDELGRWAWSNPIWLADYL